MSLAQKIAAWSLLFGRMSRIAWERRGSLSKRKAHPAINLEQPGVSTKEAGAPPWRSVQLRGSPSFFGFDFFLSYQGANE